MGSIVGFRNHPHVTDRFRSILALWSLPHLLFAFVCILVILGALLALPYRFFEDGDQHSYGYWLRESILLLSGLATVTTQEDETGIHAAAQLVGAVGGLVVPALVLGTVVFKGFVKDRVFVTRAKLALMDPQDVKIDEPDVFRWLAFRVYSSTKLQLVNVNFEVYARVKGTSVTGASIVTNVKLKLFKARWPVALPHIPYTVYHPLAAEHLQEDRDGVRLVSVTAEEDGYLHDLSGGCDILLIVTGDIPELGTDLVESHWFHADKDLSMQRFGEVDVKQYPANRKTWKVSRKWKGWTDFDE